MEKILIKAFLLYFMLLIHLSLDAQEASVTDYLNRVGEHAAIFSGEVEQAYNTVFYGNVPYYVNDEFVKGIVVYKKIFYPNVNIRLDLHKEQLIVLSPEKQYSVIVPTADVDTIHMRNHVFVNYTPLPDSRLSKGYYALLFQSQKMTLLNRSVFILNYQKPDEKKTFSERINYYLLYNNVYHAVTNKRSFYKVFPDQKKQIKRYVKEKKLNFKLDKENSLIELVNYCNGFYN